MSAISRAARRIDSSLIITGLVALIGVGASQPTALADGPGCPDAAEVYAQCPNFWYNGTEEEWIAYSDLAVDLTTADDFHLAEPSTVSRIRWWGTFLLWGSDAGCGPLAPDDFTAHIWGDAGGNPSGAEPIPLPGYSVTRSAEPVGEILVGLGPAPALEYELVFDAGGVELEGGVTYWIEFHNDTTECAWVSVTAPNPPGDGTCRQRHPAGDPNWNDPIPRGFDLAFSLLGPAPAVPTSSGWSMVITMLLFSAVAAVTLRRKASAR